MPKPSPVSNDTSSAFSTPMMLQYQRLKAQYHDCMLLFRLGDFYELFLDDALIGSKILGITLTARPRGKDGDIPMAGVPFHAADSYIARLVKSGHKVAICEQVSEPNQRTLVDRQVVRVITPGTLVDDKNLVQKENNYVFCLAEVNNQLGLAIADLSTGSFQVTQGKTDSLEWLAVELARFKPVECIVHPQAFTTAVWKKIIDQPNTTVFPFFEWDTQVKNPTTLLKHHFKVSSLAALQLKSNQAQTLAAAALLVYFNLTQQHQLSHITTLTHIQSDTYLTLDPATWTNLEIFTSHADGHTLIEVLDQTQTAMGGRLLRRWLTQPLRNTSKLNRRLDSVAYFVNDPLHLEHARTALAEISDIERILSKLTVGLGTPRDCVYLGLSLKRSLAIKELFTTSTPPWLTTQLKSLNSNLEKLVSDIDQTLTEKPPLDPKKGNVIQVGVNSELDQLRQIIGDHQNWLLGFEADQRSTTNISSLKVKFNQVFGYYIEVSKANLDKVPESFQRQQTLVSSERFTTPELKHHEQVILTTEAKIQALETQLFQDLVKTILTSTSEIKAVAQTIAHIDVVNTLAYVAYHYRYQRPTFNDQDKLTIVQGRHPVVERILGANEFVPNDIELLPKAQQLIVLTGPNMGGKSVFMRQTALIVLLAQIGSFVPAQSADLPLVDRLFVRSGAADAITSGLSTFMVEMVETAYILNHATKNSLVIMDEIGRGTSTYDGISLAWATAAYLLQHNHAKTIFATHYHELQELETSFPKQVANYHVAVAETNDQVVFLHQVQPGPADQSYGIEVAKLAGVPQEVIIQAQQQLSSLNSTQPVTVTKSLPTKTELETKINKLDLANLTPLQALNVLAQMQDQLKGN